MSWRNESFNQLSHLYTTLLFISTFFFPVFLDSISCQLWFIVNFPLWSSPSLLSFFVSFSRGNWEPHFSWSTPLILGESSPYSKGYTSQCFAIYIGSYWPLGQTRVVFYLSYPYKKIVATKSYLWFYGKFFSIFFVLISSLPFHLFTSNLCRTELTWTNGGQVCNQDWCHWSNIHFHCYSSFRLHLQLFFLLDLLPLDYLSCFPCPDGLVLGCS